MIPGIEGYSSSRGYTWYIFWPVKLQTVDIQFTIQGMCMPILSGAEGAITRREEPSEVEGSSQRWKGGIRGGERHHRDGGEQSEAKGSNQRQMGPICL